MGLVTILLVVLVIFLLMAAASPDSNTVYNFLVIACSAGPAIAAKVPDNGPWSGSGASAPTKGSRGQALAERVVLEMDSEERLNGFDLYERC
jgi:hypothetical protein